MVDVGFGAGVLGESAWVEKAAGGMSDLFLQNREGKDILGIPLAQEP